MIQESVRQCNPDNGAPNVAHVCKFTSTGRASVTDPGLPPISPDADAASTNMIMGIARVLHGKLDVEYHMFGTRYKNIEDMTNAPKKQRIWCYLKLSLAR